jgi:hypothetical protein
MGMPEHCFAYTWRRTRPDRSHDFSAKDGELRIGRVYRLTGGLNDGKWRWTMTSALGNRLGTDGGVVDNNDEACRAVEESYRRFVAGSVS